MFLYTRALRLLTLGIALAVGSVAVRVEVRGARRERSKGRGRRWRSAPCRGSGGPAGRGDVPTPRRSRCRADPPSDGSSWGGVHQMRRPP